MKSKYIKPEIEVTEMDNTVMNNTSNHNKHDGKPGHGWGAGGHYGPPGQGYTPEHPQSDEYEYEQELWEN